MALELIKASEDAWILEDPEWAAGVEGGREVLGRTFSADKEGRVCGLDLCGKWKGEALPTSVARLTALPELTMRDCKSLKSVANLPASVTEIGERAFYPCTSELPSTRGAGRYFAAPCAELILLAVRLAFHVCPSCLVADTS
jgi:hypothetical protein